MLWKKNIRRDERLRECAELLANDDRYEHFCQQHGGQPVCWPELLPWPKDLPAEEEKLARCVHFPDGVSWEPVGDVNSHTSYLNGRAVFPTSEEERHARKVFYWNLRETLASAWVLHYHEQLLIWRDGVCGDVLFDPVAIKAKRDEYRKDIAHCQEMRHRVLDGTDNLPTVMEHLALGMVVPNEVEQPGPV